MKISGKVVVPKEITDYYKALNDVHSRQLENLKAISLTEEQKELSAAQKVPLVNFVKFVPEKDEVNRIFMEVYQVLINHRPELTAHLEAVKEKLDLERKNAGTLLEQFVWQNETYLVHFLKDSQINSEFFSLLLFNTAKPVMTAYGKRLKNQVLYDKWYHNTCPVCGWKASMAVTSAENKQRMLQCSLCETTWPYKTVACTHCANDDHGTLKYLFVEDDEVYRINVCEKCRGYIKTVDESKLAVKNSSWEEDVMTIHIDIIAQNEGYLKEITRQVFSN